ncbi:unnamed protein product [Prunus brigantina]
MLSTTPGAYTLVALSEHPHDIGGQYEHAGPFVLRIVGKSEVIVWHSLCHRLARHVTRLDGLGWGSALSNVGRKIFGCRYAWVATPCNA